LEQFKFCWVLVRYFNFLNNYSKNLFLPNPMNFIDKLLFVIVVVMSHHHCRVFLTKMSYKFHFNHHSESLHPFLDPLIISFWKFCFYTWLITSKTTLIKEKLLPKNEWKILILPNHPFHFHNYLFKVQWVNLSRLKL
jgi:hypothetical protein